MGGPACAYHHQTPASAGCRSCGKPICPVCTSIVNTDAFCPGCAVGRATQLPWLAALFSLLAPGVGQVYNGEWAKAVLVFFTAPFVIPWLFGVIDAAKVAAEIAAGRRYVQTVPTGPLLLAVKILWLPLAVVYAVVITSAALMAVAALTALMAR